MKIFLKNIKKSQYRSHLREALQFKGMCVKQCNWYKLQLETIATTKKKHLIYVRIASETHRIFVEILTFA